MRTDWTKRAYTDLFLNIRHIYQDSPHNAKMVLEEIEAFVKTLKDFPFKYPKERYYNKENVRVAVKYQFKIVYRIDKNRIVIMRVFHGKQKPNKI